MATRTPLRAVLLDVGNTLLHEEPSRFEIYAEAARARGRNLSEKTMERVMRTAHADIPRKIRGAYRYSDTWFRAYIHRIFCQNLGLAPQEVPVITEELFARFEDAATFRLFPGAKAFLDSARERGLRLAVVSNWSQRLPMVLEALELAPYFEVVLASAIEELEKPEPAIFTAALERLGLSAAECLHVGDHPVNDGGAREVGIEFVRMDHAGRVDPSGADDPVVRGFEELDELVGSRLAPHAG